MHRCQPCSWLSPTSSLLAAAPHHISGAGADVCGGEHSSLQRSRLSRYSAGPVSDLPITHTTLNTRINVYTHLPSSVITVHYYTAKYDKCDGKVWRLVDFFVFHDLLVRSRVMLHAAFQELKHTYKCFLGLLAMKFKLPIYILCFRIILFSIYIMPQINFMTLSPKGHFPKPLMFTLLINVSLKQHTRELRTDRSLNKTSPSQYSLLIQSGQPILELQTKVEQRFAKISQSLRIPLLALLHLRNC